VSTVVRVEIHNTGPPASSIERPLDLAAAVVFVRLGPIVRAPEHCSRPVRQTGQGGHDARMQWRSSGLAVLCVEERGMSAGEINIAPVEGERFADAAAGEQHERHQGRQMRSATGYEAIGLIKRDPSDPAPRLRRSLKGGLVSALAFSPHAS
jgi:hypothetical protein